MTEIDHDDEGVNNPSDNTHFQNVLKARLSRRSALRGALGAAALGFMGTSLTACGSDSDDAPLGGGSPTPLPSQGPSMSFKAIPVSSKDTVVVPEGYQTQIILKQGDPISGNMPAYNINSTAADQEHQVGSHHDGMHFFPIEGKDPYQGSSVDGLLVMNHEYIEPRFLHAVAAGQLLDRRQVPFKSTEPLLRDADQVLKEIRAHGITIARIQKQADGQWRVVQDPRNRRIHGDTHMDIAGPVRGTDFVRTRYSPSGTSTRGTLNNCAHGVTPWNTYMMAEENWAGYFRNSTATAEQRPVEQSRYGVGHNGNPHSLYAWEFADENPDLNLQRFARFDVGVKGASATEDYRNEPNGQGWMVEVDPFNPRSVPIKRTTLGRFAHEGVVFAKAVEGQPIVCYSGDDARNEYIYKFVSELNYNKATASGSLLDNGTLYVAKFNDDGTGTWLALVHGTNGLTAADGFRSQAEVLIKTRSAADKVGATKMDRPEWGAVDPNNGQVYFTLTNNTSRTAVDAANPRANSRWGHIIRWMEDGKQSATSFKWDIFVLAGPKDDSRDLKGKPLTDDNMFNSPDGLWFDYKGRLWIQSDISEGVMNTGDFAQFGNNQQLCANPVTGEIKRFFTGPVGQEVTGCITTPDGKTMFINVQHPGATTSATDFVAGKLISRWPDQSNAIYPRSATVIITRKDGGVIGE